MHLTSAIGGISHGKDVLGYTDQVFVLLCVCVWGLLGFDLRGPFRSGLTMATRLPAARNGAA
jgi:hypothetical protein